MSHERDEVRERTGEPEVASPTPHSGEGSEEFGTEGPRTIEREDRSRIQESEDDGALGLTRTDEFSGS